MCPRQTADGSVFISISIGVVLRRKWTAMFLEVGAVRACPAPFKGSTKSPPRLSNVGMAMPDEDAVAVI